MIEGSLSMRTSGILAVATYSKDSWYLQSLIGTTICKSDVKMEVELIDEAAVYVTAHHLGSYTIASDARCALQAGEPDHTASLIGFPWENLQVGNIVH